jgi:hypothetical protein
MAGKLKGIAVLTDPLAPANERGRRHSRQPSRSGKEPLRNKKQAYYRTPWKVTRRRLSPRWSPSNQPS